MEPTDRRRRFQNERPRRGNEMKVYWLNGGLRLEPETDKDLKRVSAIEAAVRVLEGVEITTNQPKASFSSPELAQTALGSASKLL